MTKIHCDHTYIGGDMGHQLQGNQRKAVYLNINGRGPRMALDNISCLLQKTARIPNYFLQWIYFTYSCLPDVKIWLRWCLGVKAYRASTNSKLAGFSECLFMLWTLPLERQCGFSFLEASSLVQNPLKLTVVSLSCGDILIIIKASTQQGANWLIGWALV